MKLKIIDFNDIFKEENIITSASPLKDKEFSDDGIYSEKVFGSYDSINNIDELAWINIEPYCIIRPLFYNQLKKLFSNKLNKIINYNRSIDKNGEILEIEDTEETFEDQYMGLVDFKENFDRLLEKYADKVKHKEIYEFIIKNRDKVFVDKIPVFSSKLRPAMVVSNTLVFDDINNYYNFIIEYSNELKDTIGKEAADVEIIRLPMLYQIQQYANTITDDIISDYLKGKKGFFRKNIMGKQHTAHLKLY